MTTIQDITTWALKRIRVVAADETPSSADASDALEALNDMMFALELEGAYVNWSTVELTSTFPLTDSHRGGIRAMLAVDLAEMFAKPVPDSLARRAARGKEALQNDFDIIESMKLDDALLNMPSQRRSGYA